MEKKTKNGNAKRQYEKPLMKVVTLQSQTSLLQASPAVSTISTTMTTDSYLDVVTW